MTDGKTSFTFSPYETCTLAHILTFLWRANGSPEPTIANPFTDVSMASYYAKAAIWAYERGLVSGRTFGGSTPCSRGDAVVFL